MKLERDAIIAEALAQMAECGLAEVSLRKVAARLDATAPALRWHVGDKENLLGLMSDALFRQALGQVPACRTWEEWLLAYGRALWRAQNSIRDAARLATTAPILPEVEVVIAEIVEALAQLGVERTLGERMQASVLALVTGWAVFKQGPPGPMMAQHMPVDESVDQSLAALVSGWRARVAAAHDQPATAV